MKKITVILIIPFALFLFSNCDLISLLQDANTFENSNTNNDSNTNDGSTIYDGSNTNDSLNTNNDSNTNGSAFTLVPGVKCNQTCFNYLSACELWCDINTDGSVECRGGYLPEVCDVCCEMQESN